MDAQHPPSTHGFDVVAIASSTGGLTVLRRILSSLPRSFGAAIVVVQHRSAAAPSFLERILTTYTALPVQTIADGHIPLAGRIFVAPAGQHVALGQDGRLLVSSSERVNGVRPSADVLFASMAEVLGPRGMAVVLTGRGCDGAEGARRIRSRGGLVIVQDPRTCEADAMPRAVLGSGGADFVLSPEGIGPALETLVSSTGLASAAFGLPRISRSVLERAG